MRSRFDEQLATLNKELTRMGAMCEDAITIASKALTMGDAALADKVLSLDGEINRMERQIETLCLKLLLQQQPVAGDLRQISAALKMITDMERIGTQAADIAEIITFLNGRTGEECGHIRSMADAASRMVTESIDAFVNQDVKLAGAAIDHDDVVDDLFLQVKSSLIRLIGEKSTDGGYALDLLMIAKYFERIGDHAVNIAEWVVFSVTGVHKELSDF
ncbi:MAG: phosphate signaling complex protein PhoU [Alistipes sp.]|nr:phosphate signaling complex protein PhoU [Alistipes sp.]